jgi:hypothetical protein
MPGERGRARLVYLLLQQAVGEDDLDDGLDGVLAGPVALQLDREGDPADRLPAIAVSGCHLVPVICVPP